MVPKELADDAGRKGPAQSRFRGAQL